MYSNNGSCGCDYIMTNMSKYDRKAYRKGSEFGKQAFGYTASAFWPYYMPCNDGSSTATRRVHALLKTSTHNALRALAKNSVNGHSLLLNNNKE